MSTKSTLLYGKNFHFYHDYKDYKAHLEINDEELVIPDDFRDTLLYLTQLLEAERTKVRTLERINKLENYREHKKVNEE